jgi:hypothetical protein
LRAEDSAEVMGCFAVHGSTLALELVNEKAAAHGEDIVAWKSEESR